MEDKFKYSPIGMLVETPRVLVSTLILAISPLMLLSYLPESWQEKYIQRVWDKKKWHEIRAAYFDSCDWIDLAYSDFIPCETLDRIAAGCIVKLRDDIWPQIEKRGMEERIRTATAIH